MSTWSIVDTRNRVAARFGQAHLDLVGPSLYALAERQNYARYHYQEVKRLLSAFCERHLAATPLFVLTHGQDETARGEFEVLMTQLGAHALACVLSIHAIGDVMAFAVYQALGYGFRPHPLRERDISIRVVESRLRGSNGHMRIAELLAELSVNPDYKHVAALANKSKHQALVKPVLNEDWSGTRQQRHEVRFAAFEHGGRPFPEVEIGSLLEPAYNLASRLTVDVGNRLNDALASDAA